jgi:hypothetical protein
LRLLAQTENVHVNGTRVAAEIVGALFVQHLERIAPRREFELAVRLPAYAVSQGIARIPPGLTRRERLKFGPLPLPLPYNRAVAFDESALIDPEPGVSSTAA